MEAHQPPRPHLLPLWEVFLTSSVNFPYCHFNPHFDASVLGEGTCRGPWVPPQHPSWPGPPDQQCGTCANPPKPGPSPVLENYLVKLFEVENQILFLCPADSAVQFGEKNVWDN